MQGGFWPLPDSRGLTRGQAALVSVVLTEAELARVREHLSRFDWYRTAFERFRTRVDELIERAPVIPVAKGRAFYESCPDDNARLLFDPYAPSSHVCPKCGRDLQGEEFDLSWVRQFQEWLGKRLVEAGILYRVEGEERHARLVRDSLAHYVEHYPEYPLANNLLGPTRLFQSTYLESFWLVDMVAAFDLTRSSEVFSAGDLTGVRDLLYESAGVVRSYDERMSNRQAFNNAGMGAVALLFEDEELLDYVLAGPHGFAFHMRESLLEDGLWYEGENYHFATLDHSLNLAEMARRRGIDLYSGESGYGSLRPMFDGPLKVMLPDLTFPSRKDSWFGHGIGYHRDVYELGFARYADERYGGLLARSYSTGEADRSDLSWRTFLNLDPDLPRVAGDVPATPGFLNVDSGQTSVGERTLSGVLSVSDLRPSECERMPGTGVAVLRRDEGTVYAGLEYGHYGGGHGHPDRLHLTLFADGTHWLLDPGTGWYHVPELGWYRSTIAHNTLSVDGKLQNPREGRLLAFGDAAGFQVAQAQVEGVAEGVSMRRSLVLGEGFLLDVVDAWSEEGEAHRYDLALHTPTAIDVPAHSGDPATPGDRDGYEFLIDAVKLPAGNLDLTARSGGAVLRVVQPGEAERFSARAPGIPLREETPMRTVVSRRSGERVRFATLYLWGEDREDASFSVDGNEFLVNSGSGRSLVLIDDQPGVVVQSSSGKVAAAGRRLAWFGRARARLGGFELKSDRPLEQAALRQLDDGWHAELPDEFGSLLLTGLEGIGGNEAGGIHGLPPGASASTSNGDLHLVQPPGTAVWLDAELPLTLYAGSENTISFNVAAYGTTDAGEPRTALPDGWNLVSLERDSGGDDHVVQRWRSVVEIPAAPTEREGTLTISLDGSEQSIPYRVEAPLSTSWSVRSVEGRPEIRLVVREERGVGGPVAVELTATWHPSVEARTVELEPYGRATVSFPLPLTAPEPSATAIPCREGAWQLAGHNSSGSYEIEATLGRGGFVGTTRAKLPIYWSRGPDESQASQAALESEATRIALGEATRIALGEASRIALGEASRIVLGSDEQALWADRRWRDPADASANASISWDPRGLRLICRVIDDLHVTDGNTDDLYENDSLQIYFDFRRDHHGDRNFAPGVAAFVLAVDEVHNAVRVKEIAGNREISNRGARAGWFSAQGVTASAEPTEGGYRLDAFFPYESLGVEPLAPGQVIGFDLSLSDNDGTWYRNTQLLWSGSRGRRCYIRGSYHDPREFGWLVVGE